jgi:hypothetical protein
MKFVYRKHIWQTIGKNAPQEGKNKLFFNGDKGKRKFKGNGKMNASVKKEG